MKVSSEEVEISGRAEVGAERVEVGYGSRDQNGQGDGARDTRERGALQGVRGEGVGEGIHTREVIS